MVDVMGHLAMALLWAFPAWALWEERVAPLFVGFAVTTAMLPDVDLVLRAVLPIQHHGVTHTIVFVTAVALVAGGVIEYGLRSRLERVWLGERGYRLTAGTLFVFVTAALLFGGYSHLFADMLSAPDIAPPVNPFWPFFDKPWSVDVIWYNSRMWNAGLLVVAVVLHVLAATAELSVPHRWGLERSE
ncbi:metal-dependent hydrolase [Haloarcula onubensis]|uniref:Metal-dependent hydrolase n=1 Tax=Haloarcula onubensis TaxID=2950539 RepID=A0ABU2FVX3_9EURY|nr:metal-dependent hydrolase [Halomicroarcula sp. S3CR25-11]MDS0284599.1 metal-dependent hydrolase [Halomicroarcula sp. S3CR25-11]